MTPHSLSDEKTSDAINHGMQFVVQDILFPRFKKKDK